MIKIFFLSPPQVVPLIKKDGCARHLMSLQMWKQCVHPILYVWQWPGVGIIKYFEVVLIYHLEMSFKF